MAYGLVLVFDGATEDQYWKVNQELGVGRDGSGDWPAGLLSHVGGPVPGGWFVSEVWASRGDHQKFMSDRLGPAIGKVGLSGPSQMIESDLVNHFAAGG